MPRFSPYITHAIRAARAAGEIQRDLFGRRLEIDFKGWHDPVTEADRAAEDAIVSMLSRAFPTHAFLAEERGQQGDSAYTWLVDPLDGTNNFTHAIPWFAVSIALRHGGRLVAGAVLNTMLGEVYVAEAGGGAYRSRIAELPRDPEGWAEWPGWRRILVSDVGRLDQTLLSTGFPRRVATTGINLDHFANFMMAEAKTRQGGSAALALVAVAQGQIDGYWEIGPKAWDFAAGALLVEEAGGRVSDLRGRPVSEYGGQLLATNGRIHDQMVAVLAKGKSGLE
jgi:myo-inositol-1(or 4)-monophosphatase